MLLSRHSQRGTSIGTAATGRLDRIPLLIYSLSFVVVYASRSHRSLLPVYNMMVRWFARVIVTGRVAGTSIFWHKIAWNFPLSPLRLEMCGTCRQVAQSECIIWESICWSFMRVALAHIVCQGQLNSKRKIRPVDWLVIEWVAILFFRITTLFCFILHYFWNVLFCFVYTLASSNPSHVCIEAT